MALALWRGSNRWRLLPIAPVGCGKGGEEAEVNKDHKSELAMLSGWRPEMDEGGNRNGKHLDGGTKE